MGVVGIGMSMCLRKVLNNSVLRFDFTFTSTFTEIVIIMGMVRTGMIF